MGKWLKVRRSILSGQSDRNVRFEELCGYLRHLEFEERIRGSHHIFTRADVEEILNLQPLPDGLAKSYQVKQVRNVLVQYRLGTDDD